MKVFSGIVNVSMKKKHEIEWNGLKAWNLYGHGTMKIPWIW